MSGFNEKRCGIDNCPVPSGKDYKALGFANVLGELGARATFCDPGKFGNHAAVDKLAQDVGGLDEPTEQSDAEVFVGRADPDELIEASRSMSGVEGFVEDLRSIRRRNDAEVSHVSEPVELRQEITEGLPTTSLAGREVEVLQDEKSWSEPSGDVEDPRRSDLPQ